MLVTLRVLWPVDRPSYIAPEDRLTLPLDAGVGAHTLQSILAEAVDDDHGFVDGIFDDW